MSDKLQELTDRLYKEGLAKGREEGDRILSEAGEKAKATVGEAERKAAEIIAKAEKDAADLKSKVESDLKMASSQCVQAVKKDIENVLVDSLVKAGVSEALSGEGFLKEIIGAVAAKFSAEQQCDLSLVLPESLREQLTPWVEGELSKMLKTGVTASFSRKISGGFRIGPSDGGWYVSLTDETFSELIAEYLRPVTRKLLFGE